MEVTLEAGCAVQLAAAAVPTARRPSPRLTHCTIDKFAVSLLPFASSLDHSLRQRADLPTIRTTRAALLHLPLIVPLLQQVSQRSHELDAAGDADTHTADDACRHAA